MMRLLVIALLVVFAGTGHAENRVLVIVLDGCRPDYVTPDVMPNLHALAGRGVFFEDHHAVFPTVTRVNSPSIATGSYPESHGLMGNSIYFPAVDAERSLNTSNPANLQRIEAATEGKLLTAVSMGEVLEAAGKKLLAVSSGSGGSSFLLNHKAKGGGLINVSLILPESQRDRVLDALGPVPPDATPAGARNAWVVDAYVKFGLDETKPDLTFMWLTDPDHTAHEKGMGAPETVESLRLVDGEIGRIVAAHAERELDGTTDIVVTSDHGFSTHVGGPDVDDVLDELEIDAVTAGGAVYLKNKEDLPRLVKALQKTPGFGAIYTAATSPGAIEGVVPGTLSFDVIRWNHERAADLLVAPDWTDDEAAQGFRGTTTQGGVAGHGSDSYFDIRATLIAAGPSFKAGVRSAVPTGNVDIAPTVCRILGVEPASSMQGRVFAEAFADGPDADSAPVESKFDVAEADGYRLAVSRSIVGDAVYFNWTRVERSAERTK
jgi:predicted AlkP superfamily pyrophosphatase or phosphodiesterase